MGDESKRFMELVAVVRELRQRCPWDREQTLAGSGKHLIEEAYEAADAIGGGDAAAIADELGDLFAQALFAATLAAELNLFDLDRMLEGARQKLIRRHPHIYGDVKADTVEQVLENWERIKRDEKGQPAEEATGRVGRALPALMRAEKLGESARRAGMDWRDIRGVLAKVHEELGEAEAALARGDRAAAAEEIGDMLLALGNAPRFLDRSAEETLRRACEKFSARFDAVRRFAGERGLDLRALSDPEIDALWNEAKKTRP
jgi:MazG family protein